MVSVGKVQHLFETSKLKEFDQKDIGQRVWNCDKTGFCTAVASKLDLAKRGTKTVHEVGGGSGREYITVLGKHCISLLTLCCGSISGTRLLPYVVYKTKHLYSHLYDTWKQGGPAGALYSTSSSGWMENANFISFKKMFR